MKIQSLALRMISTMTLCTLGVMANACPDYLQGEYRKLHSKDSVDICKLVENKPVLVVNTASHCGFTSQFKEMEAVHQRYKEKGLVVIGFASDDFKQEDKDEEKAAEICYLNYGVSFTMLAPTHVKGKNANNLFKTLAEKSEAPSWNFNKYLLDKHGQFAGHYGSKVKPDSQELQGAIDKLL